MLKDLYILYTMTHETYTPIARDWAHDNNQRKWRDRLAGMHEMLEIFRKDAETKLKKYMTENAEKLNEKEKRELEALQSQLGEENFVKNARALGQRWNKWKKSTQAQRPDSNTELKNEIRDALRS
eukprot:3878850-Rhodomonas_salina.1